MAKNKSKFFAQRRPKMKVESLESRQLLASFTGGAKLMGEDITHPNGNVYDQFQMTGAAATFTADPGQTTRVSFIDKNGDIVQAEFSGNGTMQISLENFSGLADPVNYSQPGNQYVSGHANIILSDVDANGFFSFFSVGKDNVAKDANGNPLNTTLFPSTVDYSALGQADIKSVIIVPGSTNFGGFFMGNAFFSGDAGTVGINANSTNVVQVVRIGGITTTDAGVANLRFGTSSQFDTVFVQGGTINAGGVGGLDIGLGAGNSVNFIDGRNSHAVYDNAEVPVTALGVNSITLETGDRTLDLANLPVEDIGGAAQGTQQAFDNYFKGRTFSGDITITGDLAADRTISAQQFRKDLSLSGNLNGQLSVTNNIMGDLTLGQGFAGSGQIALGGNIGGTFTSEGDVKGNVLASSFGNVVINGNLSALISTDTDNGNDFDAGEGAIGNVTVTGNVAAGGGFEGQLGIGNVLVTGNVATTNFLTTRDENKVGTPFGSIGDVTVNGFVTGGGSFINVASNGTFGNVSILGGGTAADQNVGTIVQSGLFGNAQSTTGTLTVTGGAGKNVTLAGFDVNTANGTAGAITVTGAGAAGTVLDLNGTYDGAINADKFDDATIDGTLNKDLTIVGSGLAASFLDVNGTTKGALMATGFEDFNLDGTTEGATTFTGIGTAVGAKFDLNGTSKGSLTVSGVGDVDLDGSIQGATTITIVAGLASNLDVTGSSTASGDVVVHNARTAVVSAAASLAGDLTVNHEAHSDSKFTHTGASTGMVTVAGVRTVQIGEASNHGDAATLLGGSSFTLDGNVNATLTVVGDTVGSDADTLLKNFSASGFDDASFSGDVSVEGNLTLTSVVGTSGDNTSILFSEGFIGTKIGTWSIDAGAANSGVTFGTTGGVLATDIAVDTAATNSISVTGKAISIMDRLNVTSANPLSSVTLNGDVTTSEFGSFLVGKTAGSFTVNGKLTTNAGANVFLGLTDGGLTSFTTTGDTSVTGAALINLAADEDIGSISTGKLTITTGSLVSEADDIGSFTASGNVAVNGGSLINADTLASASITGTLGMVNGAQLDLDVSLGSVTVTGVATLVNSGGGVNIASPQIGALTFGGLTTTGSTGTNIQAIDDVKSAANSIASLTINGKVLGTVAGTEVRASNIGDISIIGALGQDESLITDFNVVATPYGKAGATNKDITDGLVETVAADGSNLSSYKIGNITIQSTLSAAFTGTSLFSSDSSFSALGGIGNITITGAVAGGQQSRLFKAATDGAWFAAGDTGNLLDATVDLTNIFAGTSSTVTSDAATAFTGDYTGTSATVSIGNVSVNTLQSNTAVNVSLVDNIAGSNAAAGASLEGLAILSGVRTNTDGDLIIGAGAVATEDLSTVDTGGDDLKGTIGTVLIGSNNAVGFLETVATLGGVTATNGDNFSVIAASHTVGNLQGGSTGLTGTQVAIIGDANATADVTLDTATQGSGEILIILI